VDLAAEQRLAGVLTAGADAGLLAAAHDLSDGGLALALAECCLTGGGRAAQPGAAGGTGCVVTLPAERSGAADSFIWLFSESAGRAIAVPRRGAEAEFAAICAEHGVPAMMLGVTGGQALEVTGLFAIPVAELGAVHRRTLPALFG
jgi:phosphoribosylformylglycinamidine synthase